MKSDTIRMIRVSKGLTQEEFARRLKVSRATIAGIESNQRNVSDRVRIRIAQLFGGDPDVEEAIIKAREFEKLPL